MKKRLIALALCLVMLATCLGAGMLAPTPVMLVDENGAAATSAAVPQLGRKTLTASYADATETTGYQWQFSNDGDTWIDIYGETAQTCSLSYAKVKNMLDADGKAQLRCVVTDGEDERVSSAATVTVDYSAQTAEAQSGVSVMAAPARAASYARSAEPQSDDAPKTCSVIINYVFADGTQAANPWTATIAKGSSINRSVTSPTVLGYAPDQAEVVVNVTDIQDTVTYTVRYYPAEVEFTVKHYKQNVSNDYYTLSDTDTTKGYTESAVGENLAKNYEGFYSLLYDTSTKIAADGSTVVEIYYDRYYYLMSFDLDGGYGVEPIYARYGAPISVDTPTKPGYTFEGWTPSIPATMPADNTSYKASWKIGESGFTVVFWYENANDDGYSVAGTYKPADVKPGTQKKSEDYKNQSFTGRDDKHFTYNTAKSETVTVKGDGSTVLNVYYTRNTYTLTFLGAGTTLICAKVEHTHSSDTCCDKSHWFSCNGYGLLGWCNADNCPVGYEHTHSNDCYGLTITAKYQADIHNNFPIKDGNDTIWWKVPQGTETYGNSDEQRYLGSIDTMPGENITFEKYDTESGAKIYYYVETLNGAAGDTAYKGKNYKQYKVIDLEYSSRTNLTYAEEFHPITGFSQGDSNPKLPVGGEVQMKKTNYLYYTRNSYNLKFYNYNAYVDGKGGSVQYEAPLSSYHFTPEYPADLEKNAYVFAGWYTTSGCYEGSEADLNTMTMPASDVILYAKWVPKTHTVKTYLTKDVLDNSGDPIKTWAAVPHGTAVKDSPEDPTRDPYKFVGWFYISDTDEEKAFDFSMPVNRDLNLYAKWSSNTLMEYTIRYELENGTEIAPPTTGSALAGTTKTFNAKTGTELNEGYQSGYFPKVSSHSITMDIEDASKNEFTFVYVAKEEVRYTVRYLDKTTGKPVVVDGVPTPDKEVKTRDAVVTETFKQIKGYAPDAYQKQLVLAAENNEIIFWYTKDNVHAPVQIIHWIQNIAGDGYTEYQSSTNLNGVIENPYSETPLTIAGFQYNGGKSNASGTLTEAGLVLNLYYDRIEYPYEFRFVEKDSSPEKQLADSVTGRARYQAQVTQTAKTIPGYTLVSAENQAINIAIEDPADTANKNVRVFYYTENEVTINYQVVGPDGCGTVTPASETLKVLTGTAQGSTAEVSSNVYRFVGWYSDAECTNLLSTEAKYVPAKINNLNVSATYYAKFEQNLTDLTIKKEMESGSPYDANDMFIFTVKDSAGKEVAKVALTAGQSVTIKNLTVGETYTVTEDNNWSWRYKDVEAQEITLEPSGNEVTVTNTIDNNNWLGASSYAINQCINNTVKSLIDAFKSILGN